MNPLDASTDSNMEFYPNLKQKGAAILRLLEQSKTPIFLCERDNLSDRYRALKQSLEVCWGPSIIGYSFKTNYLVAKSGIFRELGTWAEVVSGHEYRLARSLGYSGDSIIFNGPYKTDEELLTAVADGALLNINDHDELDRIIKIASSATSPVAVGIRVSSSLPRLGLSRFGFSLENTEASQALDKIQRCKQVHLVALHTHLYGDTDDPELYGLAARRLGEFAAREIPKHEHTIRFIDLGGGFPAHSPKPKSRQTWNPRPIDTYIRYITDSLCPFFPDEKHRPTLIVEPGRYLTCDGVLLVTRVNHVKERDQKQHINCNGSISMLPLTHYCPQIIRAYTSELNPRVGREVPSILYGATCRENDILYTGPFPQTKPGDYLVHFAAGAYNSSLSPEFIFETPGMELF